MPAGDGDGGRDGDGQREVDGPRESQEGRGEEGGRGQDGRRKGGFLFLSFFVIICNYLTGRVGRSRRSRRWRCPTLSMRMTTNQVSFDDGAEIL